MLLAPEHEKMLKFARTHGTTMSIVLRGLFREAWMSYKSKNVKPEKLLKLIKLGGLPKRAKRIMVK